MMECIDGYVLNKEMLEKQLCGKRK